jgi:hypothetical protein
MGHSRIGTLPATRKWKEVVSLIANGADEARIAEAVMMAAAKMLARVRDDAGFREAMRLVMQLALAGSSPNPGIELAAAGLALSENSSQVDMVVAIGDEYDRRIEATRQRSDFSEIAQSALVGAVTALFNKKEPQQQSLFESSRADVVSAIRQLKQPRHFGEFFRGFVSGITNGLLQNYLSRTNGTHLGEGKRFATTNQERQFEHAMKQHCWEASKIVEKFATDWIHKYRDRQAGDISREKAEGFGWVAFRKVNLELALRAQ